METSPLVGPDGPGRMDDPAGDRSAPTDGAPDAVVDVDLDVMAADLDAVDAALRRLDEGTYGTCETCAEPLAGDLLAADPVRRRCEAHPADGTRAGSRGPGTDVQI